MELALDFYSSTGVLIGASRTADTSLENMGSAFGQWSFSQPRPPFFFSPTKSAKSPLLPPLTFGTPSGSTPSPLASLLLKCGCVVF